MEPCLLEQIETARQELVETIKKLTGLPGDDISLDLSFHNQMLDSDLPVEAYNLGWRPEEHNESKWFELDSKIDGGGISVFIK